MTDDVLLLLFFLCHCRSGLSYLVCTVKSSDVLRAKIDHPARKVSGFLKWKVSLVAYWSLQHSDVFTQTACRRRAASRNSLIAPLLSPPTILYVTTWTQMLRELALVKAVWCRLSAQLRAAICLEQRCWNVPAFFVCLQRSETLKWFCFHFIFISFLSKFKSEGGVYPAVVILTVKTTL